MQGNFINNVSSNLFIDTASLKLYLEQIYEPPYKSNIIMSYLLKHPEIKVICSDHLIDLEGNIYKTNLYDFLKEWSYEI